MKRNHKRLYILCAVAVVAILLAGAFCLKKENPVVSEDYGSETEEEIQGWYQAQMYIEQEIPELADYEYYISKKSGGQAYLDVYCNRTNPVELYNNYKEFLGYYYPVFVDETWEDHSVSWECFYVSEDIQEILWREIVECEYYSIEEWRATSQYKDRMDRVMEFLNEERE